MSFYSLDLHFDSIFTFTKTQASELLFLSMSTKFDFDLDSATKEVFGDFQNFSGTHLGHIFLCTPFMKFGGHAALFGPRYAHKHTETSQHRVI